MFECDLDVKGDACGINLVKDVLEGDDPLLPNIGASDVMCERDGGTHVKDVHRGARGIGDTYDPVRVGVVLVDEGDVGLVSIGVEQRGGREPQDHELAGCVHADVIDDLALIVSLNVCAGHLGVGYEGGEGVGGRGVKRHDGRTGWVHGII